MAEINNSQVTRFVNEILRPLNDEFAGLFYRALQARDKFNAQGLSALIPPTDDLIIDGSGADGRPTMTGMFVHIEMAQVEGFLQLSQSPGGNGEPSLLNNVNSVAVNPRY